MISRKQIFNLCEVIDLINVMTNSMILSLICAAMLLISALIPFIIQIQNNEVRDIRTPMFEMFKDYSAITDSYDDAGEYYIMIALLIIVCVLICAFWGRWYFGTNLSRFITVLVYGQ